MNQERLRQLLHEQNFRLTRERQSLLELFVQSERMLTPAQLHEWAQEHGARVGLTTVYRLLEVLTKVGAAMPFLVDGNVYYAFCSDGHHHHFVCLSCHRVHEIRECPSFLHVPREFQVESHRADLFGTCPHCQSTTPDAAGTGVAP
ncbi:Fur family transcriptional regulator [Alicyclobacillus shizuokensis]|uniref:Fur family transcriptional regulator n=1 Tax=Alicyclobacillus shizuokensis TaxID=392014 RepID=UPI000835A476|nr:Fur family transcriptional regulator [Alicyclobacillus shizuokensis]MCL6626022.1 transcriptional repressor [Alicyclobacillus shizuokensis]